jgi:hypothetical protein
MFIDFCFVLPVPTKKKRCCKSRKTSANLVDLLIFVFRKVSSGNPVFGGGGGCSEEKEIGRKSPASISRVVNQICRQFFFLHSNQAENLAPSPGSCRDNRPFRYTGRSFSEGPPTFT